MSGDLLDTRAIDLAAAVRAGRVRAGDVAEAVIRRIADVDPALNTMVVQDADRLRGDAALVDAMVRAGEDPGPLAGVPYSLKESTAAAGLPHTGGMAAMAGHVAPADSVVARRLRAAGGLLAGKTNLPENGYYCGTRNHLYGTTRNPWDLEASPGGSSGGAAASVAARITPLADGSDGAGSIRVPAALCGVVGFKPSTGRIPQQLLPAPFATFLAHGIIARSVADVALMLDVEAGPDARDPLSLPDDPLPYGDAQPEDLRGWRIAWSEDLGIGGLVPDPEVVAICARAVEAFGELGATVVEAAPDWPDPEQAMWDGVWLPAYAPDLGAYPWDELGGRVDPELEEIVRAGARTPGAVTAAAELERGRIHRAFVEFMDAHDLLASPTVRVAGYPADAFGPEALAGEPLRRRILGWINTYPFNLTATPAISVPVGVTSAGLPVGLQLAAGHLEDRRVLHAASALERVRPWDHLRPPPLPRPGSGRGAGQPHDAA